MRGCHAYLRKLQQSVEPETNEKIFDIGGPYNDLPLLRGEEISNI